MLSYYNKYYTRLQVLYYATLATSRLYLSRAYERGEVPAPPPPHSHTNLSDFVFKSEGKKKDERWGGTC